LVVVNEEIEEGEIHHLLSAAKDAVKRPDEGEAEVDDEEKELRYYDRAHVLSERREFEVA
jgi:hypothetical protein